MAKELRGKAVSEKLKEKLSNEIKILKENGIVPQLSAIILGENQASLTYIKNKKALCEEIGINLNILQLSEQINQYELIKIIDELNNDKNVNGILVELPLPKHIDEKLVIESIRPIKDVDAFNPTNLGKIMIGDYSHLPCTAAGVFELIKTTGISIEGKNCVIIGRSNIVGKPLAMLMMNENATVTVCHSQTNNIKEFTKQADILISAVGREAFVSGDMIKSGAVVIDVGMNRNKEGKLCGDVIYNEAEKVAAFLTPVPGGVGPMTVTILLRNTVNAAAIQNNIQLKD